MEGVIKLVLRRSFRRDPAVRRKAAVLQLLLRSLVPLHIGSSRLRWYCCRMALGGCVKIEMKTELEAAEFWLAEKRGFACVEPRGVVPFARSGSMEQGAKGQGQEQGHIPDARKALCLLFVEGTAVLSIFPGQLICNTDMKILEAPCFSSARHH